MPKAPSPTDDDWRAFRQALAEVGIAPADLVGAYWSHRQPNRPYCDGGDRFWFHPKVGPPRLFEFAWQDRLLPRALTNHMYKMGSVRLLPRDMAACPAPLPLPQEDWFGFEQDFPIHGERVLTKLRELALADRIASAPERRRRRV